MCVCVRVCECQLNNGRDEEDKRKRENEKSEKQSYKKLRTDPRTKQIECRCVYFSRLCSIANRVFTQEWMVYRHRCFMNCGAI